MEMEMEMVWEPVPSSTDEIYFSGEGMDIQSNFLNPTIDRKYTAFKAKVPGGWFVRFNKWTVVGAERSSPRTIGPPIYDIVYLDTIFLADPEHKWQYDIEKSNNEKIQERIRIRTIVLENLRTYIENYLTENKIQPKENEPINIIFPDKFNKYFDIYAAKNYLFQEYKKKKIIFTNYHN